MAAFTENPAPSASADPAAPLVSVIIPTYCCRGYLQQSLDSVFRQSFTDYEVIVVDDGSPDDVAGSVRPLIDSGKIRYIKQKNSGPAAARNRGLAESRGEFIAFLDDDDLWEQDSLAWRVESLKANPGAVLVYGGTTLFDSATGPKAEDDFFPGDVGPSGKVHHDFLVRNWIHSPGQTLIRGSVLRAMNGLDENLYGTEDYDLWIRLAAVGDYVYIPKRALFYRSHPSSISKNIWKMHYGLTLVRRKHMGRFPSPATYGVWMANWRFWGTLNAWRYAHAAEASLEKGDKKSARESWIRAVWIMPTLLRRWQIWKMCFVMW